VHFDVKYSEPDLTIAVDISQVLANTELDPLNDQKTQVVTENKTVKFSPLLPLLLVVVVVLGLVSGLLLAKNLKPQKPLITPSPTPTGQVQNKAGTENR
ncbi:MAG: hypothetical protein ACKPER_23500, partial [Dolichospermum sp.]